jgi:uncharacterized protein YdhG (YjbR/CyaY superfamily)
MKRSLSNSQNSAGTQKKVTNTVDDYLATIPQQSRKAFLDLRSIIRSALPREAEEIISYRIPAFKHNRVLVWFAAFANHCSLFPTAAVIQQFKNELKEFSKSKGTIQFPLDRPLPKALIKKMVKARVSQAESLKRG